MLLHKYSGSQSSFFGILRHDPGEKILGSPFRLSMGHMWTALTSTGTVTTKFVIMENVGQWNNFWKVFKRHLTKLSNCACYILWGINQACLQSDPVCGGPFVTPDLKDHSPDWDNMTWLLVEKWPMKPEHLMGRQLQGCWWSLPGHSLLWDASARRTSSRNPASKKANPLISPLQVVMALTKVWDLWLAIAF